MSPLQQSLTTYVLVIIFVTLLPGSSPNESPTDDPDYVLNITTANEEQPESMNDDVAETDTTDQLPDFTKIQFNHTLAENVTLENVTQQNGTTTSVKSNVVACIELYGDSEVKLVNDTELIALLAPDSNVTSKDTPGNCVAVLFYSKYCPFSSMAAPHFNALPRAFPDLKMVAINAMMYPLFNTQNGIMGVPSFVLFHGGRPVSKYNESEYTLELFSRFVTKHTGIKPVEKSYVKSADFSGPVSSVPSKETDFFLGLSWAFIVFCAVYYFTKSKWWKWIVESVQNNWREAEAQAQHEHAD